MRLPLLPSAMLVGLCLSEAILPSPASAHRPQPVSSRMLLRAQGYLARPAAGVGVVREVELEVLGNTLRFFATEWRAILVGKPAQEDERARRYTVQGSRTDLRRLRGARPEQRVTILAERRPGSRDLFVVAVDLCPER